jgi:1,4-alpha-glucan branching enzyme
MGSEFGQFIEWKYDDSLDWHLVQEYPMHAKMEMYSKSLNAFYLQHQALWEVDFDWHGFEWIDCNDNENSVISFIRKGKDPDNFLIVVCNFTPAVYHEYRIGVPVKGSYREIFNSDAELFGGSNVLNKDDICTENVIWHNQEQSIRFTVPPLATIYFQLQLEKKTINRSVGENIVAEAKAIKTSVNLDMPKHKKTDIMKKEVSNDKGAKKRSRPKNKSIQ